MTHMTFILLLSHLTLQKCERKASFINLLIFAEWELPLFFTGLLHISRAHEDRCCWLSWAPSHGCHARAHLFDQLWLKTVNSNPAPQHFQNCSSYLYKHESAYIQKSARHTPCLNIGSFRQKLLSKFRLLLFSLCFELYSSHYNFFYFLINRLIRYF